MSEVKNYVQEFTKQPEFSSPEMQIFSFEMMHENSPAMQDKTHSLSEYCRDESCWD